MKIAKEAKTNKYFSLEGEFITHDYEPCSRTEIGPKFEKNVQKDMCITGELPG